MANLRWTCLGLLASLAAAPIARAQSASDKAAAEALFDEGKRLREAKRYSEACPKFADSQRLDPAVGTLLNLALCYKEAGQTASAWSTYREAAAQAAAAHQADREELARNEASALESKLTKLVIEVAPEVASVQGVEVKRAGAVVPPGLWGVPSPVDPGVQVIDVTAPAKKPVHMETKAEGAGATAKVVISAMEDAPIVDGGGGAVVVDNKENKEEKPIQKKDTAAKPGQTQRIIGYVVTGAGIVGLGVGGYFTLQTLALNSEAEDICSDPDDNCSKEDEEDHDDLINQAEASQLNSYVGYGLGIAGVVTGVVLIVTAPSAPKKAATLQVAPEFGRDHTGLTVRGTF